MSRTEVLALPARSFWFMAGCITRLLAEQDMRSLSVTSAAQSAEGFEELAKRLVIEMEGKPLIPEAYDPANVERDEDGFDELRNMAF